MNHIAILFKNGIEEKRNHYPRMDMQPIIGLEADLEWKLLIDSEKPVYDANLERLVKSEDNTDDPHPVYPHLKTVIANYVSERKTDNEIIQSIENLKQSANQQIIYAQGQSEELQYLTLYALIRLAKGQSVPPAANLIALTVEDIAQGILANGVNAEVLINEINLGNSPDINTGWIYE